MSDCECPTSSTASCHLRGGESSQTTSTDSKKGKKVAVLLVSNERYDNIVILKTTWCRNFTKYLAFLGF